MILDARRLFAGEIAENNFPVAKRRVAPKQKAEPRTDYGFDIDQAAEALKAIGNVERFGILSLLSAKSLDVLSISERVGMGQSATSQHLKILKMAGLVIDTRVGNRIVYSLKGDAASRLIASSANGSNAPTAAEGCCDDEDFP